MKIFGFLLASLATSSVVMAERPVLSIHGSGTTNPSKCYWHIMDKMEARAKLPMHMTYRAIGSSSGQKEMNNNPPITYFGSGDIPLTKEIYENITRTETVLQLPVLVSAISFFHSVPNTPTLNLTACTLAKIMNREIVDWGNEEIKSINPELEVSSGGLPIRVARRVYGSSSTSGITQYLANACPEIWGADNYGSTIEWAAGTLECEGSGGVEDCIAEEPGTIGYLDAGHGHQAGFEEIYLENTFGTKLTTVQSAAQGGIAGAGNVEGLLPDNPTDDFSTVSLINQPGEYTWPIAAMTYVYVRQDLSFIESPQEQALLKAFLQALYDDSYVQQCVDAYEFSKVDGKALNITKAGVESLIVNSSAMPFMFEEGTLLNEGQGDYYISAKRRSASEVEIEVLETANAQLRADLSAVEQTLKQTQLQVASLTSGSTSSSGSEGSTTTGNQAQATIDDIASDNDKQSNQIAAALAMSIIAMLLSLVGVAMIFMRQNSAQPLPVDPHTTKMDNGAGPMAVEHC